MRLGAGHMAGLVFIELADVDQSTTGTQSRFELVDAHLENRHACPG